MVRHTVERKLKSDDESGENQDLKRLLALRHRISIRLYLAITFAVLLTFAASVVGLFSFDRLGAVQDRVNNESIPEIAAAFAVAQYAGDLVTASDRLSIEATVADWESFGRYVNEIEANLSDRVTFLSELSGDTEDGRLLLERVQASSNALLDGISQFENNVFEYFEVRNQGEKLRRHLTVVRAIWDDVVVSVMDDELSYSLESGNGTQNNDLTLLLELQSNANTAAQSLSGASVATDVGDIEPLQASFMEASAHAEDVLADLDHLPSQANLSQAFAQLWSMGSGDENGFDVWSRELMLEGERQQLLDANYRTALLLIGDVEELVLNAQSRTRTTTEAAAQTAGLGRAILLGISVVSVVGALLVAWLLVGSLLNRLGRISGRMRLMAGGELDEPVVVSGKDEVADMATSLEVFRNNAREAIRLNLVEELAQFLQERNEELTEALANLQKAQDRLIAQEKLSALGELVTGLAHEINNPLNFVNNFSEVSGELLEELEETLEKGRNGGMDDEDLEIVDEIISDLGDNMTRINTNGGRASRIVQSMLTMGRATDAREPTDINRMLREYVRLAYQNASSADEDFRLELQFDCEDLDQVQLNERDIGRLFINLANNACYATDEKRRKLGDEDDAYTPVFLISTRQNDDEIEIRMRDNGTGIEPDVMDKIFNPFFTTKPTDQGTGLGLTICNDVVREYGGSIRISSEPGEFTEVMITLPTDSPVLPDSDALPRPTTALPR